MLVTTDEMPAAVGQEKRSANYSMKGLAYLPMPLGAIRIGHSIDMPGGEVVPIRDDEFRITRNERDAHGNWLEDTLNRSLRHSNGSAGESVEPAKLRQIPIQIHINDPALVARSRLEAFDRTTKRTVCSSDGGGVAMRLDGHGKRVKVDCVGCDNCPFANSGRVDCKFFGRIAVQIKGQTDELGTYVMRSSSINSMRTFEAKLWQYWSLFGGKLRGVPFVMKLRAAQTELSQWGTFYFVDLELHKVKLAEAVKLAKDQQQQDIEAGLDVESLEAVMRLGLENGSGGLDAAEDGVDLSEFISTSSFHSTAIALDPVGAPQAASVKPVEGGGGVPLGAPEARAVDASKEAQASGGIFLPNFGIELQGKSESFEPKGQSEAPAGGQVVIPTHRPFKVRARTASSSV